MFPFKEWFEKAVEIANADEELKELGEGLDVDFLFAVIMDEESINDLKDESSFRNILSGLAMIPKEDRKYFRGTALYGVFKRILEVSMIELEERDTKELFEKVSELNLEDLEGVSINVWLDFHHGQIRKFTPVAPGQHSDADFKISGTYGTWKKIVLGKIGISESVGKGYLELKGEWSLLMGNLAFQERLDQLICLATLSFKEESLIRRD